MNQNIDCFLVQGNLQAKVYVDLEFWLKICIRNLRLKFFPGMTLQYLSKQAMHLEYELLKVLVFV